jgi:hypothetical protein
MRYIARKITTMLPAITAALDDIGDTMKKAAAIITWEIVCCLVKN